MFKFDADAMDPAAVIVLGLNEPGVLLAICGVPALEDRRLGGVLSGDISMSSLGSEKKISYNKFHRSSQIRRKK